MDIDSSFEKLIAEMRSKSSELFILEGSPVRLVGMAEDEADYYYIVEGPKGPATRFMVSVLCQVIPFRQNVSAVAYNRLEHSFKRSGSRPVAFIVDTPEPEPEFV